VSSCASDKPYRASFGDAKLAKANPGGRRDFRCSNGKLQSHLTEIPRKWDALINGSAHMLMSSGRSREANSLRGDGVRVGLVWVCVRVCLCGGREVRDRPQRQIKGLNSAHNEGHLLGGAKKLHVIRDDM
jgi:hypothetical protein